MTHTTSRLILVLEIDLIIQEWHDQAGGRTGSTTLLPLVASHRVVAVQRTLAVLIEPAEDGRDVVREEALAVEDVRQALGARRHAHGLAVVILVHLDDVVEALFEGVAVGRESDDGEDDAGSFVFGPFSADEKELRGVARVDAVPGRAASVAG